MSQRRTNRNPDTNNVQMKKNLHQHKAFNSPEHVNCSPNQCPTQKSNPHNSMCNCARTCYLLGQRAAQSETQQSFHQKPSALRTQHEAAASLRRMLSSVCTLCPNCSTSPHQMLSILPRMQVPSKPIFGLHHRYIWRMKTKSCGANLY